MSKSLKLIFFDWKLIPVFFIIFYETSIAYVIGLKHQFWGDEHHFYDSIVLFGKGITLETLRTYNEMTTPFTFILYSLWGHLVGFNLENLRILSLFISAITLYRLFVLLSQKFDFKTSIGLWLTFCLNPYVIGLSLFIYTDMLSILLVIEFTFVIINNSKIKLLLVGILLLYTRQYNITFLISGILYYLLINRSNLKKSLPYIGICITSMISVLPLFYIWKGIAPNSLMRSTLGKHNFSYQITALNTYVYSIFIYTLPISLISLIKIIYKKNIAIIILTLLIFVPISIYYPIEATKISVNDGFNTVGLFHKLISSFINSSYVNIIFIILINASAVYLVNVIIKQVSNLNHNKNDLELFCTLNLLVFLIILPFSYQIWEKYILTILPMGLICLGSSLKDS